VKTVSVQGVQIPQIGFGTAGFRDDLARQVVGHALAVGYRHIDTAQNYGNEAEVGAAVRQSGIARGEIWLTTKIWPDRFRNGALQRAAEASVERLGSVPDLLLLHWPSKSIPLAETVAALNDARQKGLCRHIGVSNFTKALIEEAAAISEAPLIANQVEYHPFLRQPTLRDSLGARDMAMIASSPLAQGKVFREPALRDIAERHGKTAGQVALRWLIQQNVIPIPGSTSQAHIAANLAVFDFALSEAEMDRISGLGSLHGRLNDRLGHAPAWDDLGMLDLARRELRRAAWYVSARLRRFRN